MPNFHDDDCDCAGCRDDEDRFWREQAGEGNEREGCVLGDQCCCPHIFHTADECHSAEDAEAAQAVPTTDDGPSVALLEDDISW